MLEWRAIGLEMEYGISLVQAGGTQLVAPDHTTMIGLVARYTPTKLKGLPEGANELPRMHSYLGNGGRLYADHAHPEYATPPAMTLDELVATSIAGERITEQTFRNAQENKPPYGRAIEAFVLNNRVISDVGDTWGYHENYQVDRRFLDPHKAEGEHRDAFDMLGAHLATRNLYCGAGAMFRGAFIVGQKASHLTCDYSVVTTYEKPLINLRDEPHADQSKFARLHVTCGDPHMSPWALRMSVGTTAMIISMIEDGVRIDDDTRLPHDRMHIAARQIAFDPDCNKQLTLVNGSKTTALAIQEALLKKAQHWARERSSPLTPDEQFVLSEWERTLKLFREDPLLLKDRVEWIRKRALLGGLIAKINIRRDTENQLHCEEENYEPLPHIGYDSPEIAERELQFDRLGTVGSIGEILRSKVWAEWMPPEELIRERMLHGPPGRGNLIGQFITRFAKVSGAEAFWEYVRPPEQFRSGPIYLSDPRITAHPRLEYILSTPMLNPEARLSF